MLLLICSSFQLRDQFQAVARGGRPRMRCVSQTSRISKTCSLLHRALAEAEHIGVIVAAAHLRLHRIAGTDGPDAGHLVGGDAHAEAGAADKDAAVSLAAGDGPRDLDGVRRDSRSCPRCWCPCRKRDGLPLRGGR